MSICDIIKNPFNESVLLAEIKRDYGLSNINNVNPGVDICAEVFNGPTFTSNFTELISGLTETSSGVFDITNNDLTFTYTFTGNTDTLTAYTGNFQYKIYARNIENPTRTVNNITGIVPTPPTFIETLTYSASTPFSAITNSGFTFNDTISLDTIDQEYVFNSNFNFLNKDCLIRRNITTTNLENTYENGYSLYFVTLVKPEIPKLGPFKPAETLTPSLLTVNSATKDDRVDTYVFTVPQATTDSTNSSSVNCKLITETLDIGPTLLNTFTLSYYPFDDSVMVSVNGITLSSLDYTITNNVILTISENLDPNRDVITVTYLACDSTVDSISSEQYLITGVTSGSTSAYVPTEKVYYNTDHSKYEYYTNYQSNGDENTILFLNGVKLTYGLDYYNSVTVNNRIIFDSTTLGSNDIIHVIYTYTNDSEGNYGYVNIPGKDLEWQVLIPTIVNERTDGNFLVEITESWDKTFSSTATTQQITVDYINNQSLYTASVPSGLIANNTYIWRVTNNKVYSGLLGNIFTKTNTSKVGKISFGNGINSY